eukprot:jgi/Ulvmu1/1933/UM012_0093.1
MSCVSAAVQRSQCLSQGLAQRTVGRSAVRNVVARAAGKTVTKKIKLAIEAGKANPAPPIGPALGAAGLNIMDFCKAYNAQTQDKMGQVIPVEISVYEDRTFEFVLKTPPASKLILSAAGLAKGSGTPQKIVGSITEAQLKEIAETKLPDLNARDVQAAMKIVHGTCRNMGVDVVNDELEWAHRA